VANGMFVEYAGDGDALGTSSTLDLFGDGSLVLIGCAGADTGNLQCCPTRWAGQSSWPRPGTAAGDAALCSPTGVTGRS